MVAVRVVDPDRQLDRYPGAGLDAVEGGFGRTRHQGPGMQFAVVQDDHEGGAVGQAPGGGVGDRPRNVDFVLCLGIAGQGQIGNLAAAQAGGGGAVPAVVIKQVAAGEAGTTEEGRVSNASKALPNKRYVMYANLSVGDPATTRSNTKGDPIPLLKKVSHNRASGVRVQILHVGCTFRAGSRFRRPTARPWGFGRDGPPQRTVPVRPT